MKERKPGNYGFYFVFPELCFDCKVSVKMNLGHCLHSLVRGCSSKCVPNKEHVSQSAALPVFRFLLIFLFFSAAATKTRNHRGVSAEKSVGKGEV